MILCNTFKIVVQGVSMKEIKSQAAIADQRNINKLRKELGMRLIRRGNRKCLCCNKNFASPDIATQKMCNRCRETQE